MVSCFTSNFKKGIISPSKMIQLLLQIIVVASTSNFIFGAIVKTTEANGIIKTAKGKLDEVDDADICPIKNPRYPILIPHLEDCSKFYICDNGSPHLKTCQEGLHFNARLKSCDYLDKAGCETGITKTPKEKVVGELDAGICPIKNSRYPILISHPEDCTKFYICDNGSPHLKTCQQGLHFNAKLKSCDYPKKAGCETGITERPKGKIVGDVDAGICPIKNPRYPILIPHPEDCTKFYICDNGSPHLKTCQQGLHFNAKLKSCDYADKAGCETGITERPKGKIVGDVDAGICPIKNPRYPILIPHPEDCTKFYICDSGSPHLKTCQLGLHFNAKLKSCDYPDKAECETGITERPKGKVVGDVDAGICPIKNPRYPILIPHSEDCTKFYICDNGSPHLKTCQQGLHFNAKLKSCDYPDKAGCETDVEGMQKVKEAKDGAFTLCPKEQNGSLLIPHPIDCTLYYVCVHGMPMPQRCPRGLHFNPTKQLCDFPKNAGCDLDAKHKPKIMEADDEDFDSCTMTGDRPLILPHPTDCASYFVCFHGIRLPNSCPLGLHFNPIQQVCDFPDNSRCDKNGISSLPQNAVQQAPGVSSPFCPPIDGKIPIFFRSSSNCSIYYMCSNGLAYEFACPSRLHFNLRRRMCDYEENAKCQLEFV